MSLHQTSWPELLEMLIQGKDLSDDQATSLISAWLQEELTPVQTGAFLAALRVKGPTGEELAAMAKVLRKACSLPCSIPEISMVDTCGTGGDGAETFNISTAVAFTAAACGAKVAKHGNRSASGKVGSADVLEELGICLSAPLELVVQAITKSNVTFLFAPAWHSSLVKLAPLRKSLGVRTIFNLLGPLVNPLLPQSQVLGVAKSNLLDPMVDALQKLGLKRAVVVHGAGGLDEASLAGPNDLRFLVDGKVTSAMIDPSDMGLTSSPVEALKGGDVSFNKQILVSVLKGEGTIPQRDVVALNTSLVLWAAGVEEDLDCALSKSLNCLKEGLPFQSLESLKRTLDSSH
ncbi:anthranilate phosphoribosyltransferase [Prochlorococcus sp. MIT 1307]|uniref:anthranilate phosphoribosyltransferase n=1 Tax=Prochlorococcus sp. MIT 1307 TaxID=3096219 RepID=UPI002A74D9F2|nr:anthranilate phosphoribosyltransferase [Prochlorococcus sp. MIT 1307]